ncbi:MAG: glycosyltransferase [Pseudomonadota bacterium]
MRISVALCTYNGERFLPEQLDSLARQTLRPHEVVVCDDGSTDRTVELLPRFAKHAPFPVRVYRNERNLGVIDNFHRAARLCEGRYVAFCDQDDVWREDKLARCAAALAAEPDVLLLLHGATVVDEALNPLWDMRPQGDEPAVLEPLQMPPWYAAKGMSMVFDRALAHEVDWSRRPPDQHNPDGMYHDVWVQFLANVLGRTVLLPKPLVAYRQHGGNVSGVQEGSAAKRLGNGLRSGYADYRRFAELGRRYTELLHDLAGAYRGTWQARLRDGAAYYGRLADIYAGRAAIHEPGAGVAARLARLARFARAGGYRPRANGGFGMKSLVKDSLAVWR